jgi:hypothetical protein
MAGGGGRLARRRWAIGLVVLGMVAGGAAACGSSASDGGDGGDGRGGDGGPIRPAPTGEAIDLAQPGVHQLTLPPLEGLGEDGRRWIGIQVPMAGEVAFWGGGIAEHHSANGTLLGDGALLSAEDGRWTAMPPAPFEPGLYEPAGAWDGTELIVIGTECEAEVPPATDGSPPACPKGPAAAAFDPVSFTWRRLPAPPIPAHEVYEERVLGRSVAVGGGGRALFAFGWDVDAIAWDRDGERWTAIEPPQAVEEVDNGEACADPIAGQIVAAVRSDGAPGSQQALWVLPLDGGPWVDPGVALPGEGHSLSCGSGRAAVSWLDVDAGSRGALADLATGEVVPAFEPTRDLRSGWIVGPWLFARSSITIGAEGIEALPKPLAVQLLGTDRSAEVAPEDLGRDGSFEGMYVADAGVLLGRATTDLRLWVPPVELQP